MKVNSQLEMHRKIRSQMQKKNTNHFFSRLEYQLLIQLQQIEPILRLPRLGIDLGQELAHHNHHLRQSLLVWAIVRCMFKDGFEEQWVACETRRRFR